MRLFLATFFITILSQPLFSQDIIYTKKGEKIEAVVVLETQEELIFKSTDNPEFDNTSLPISEISKIEFKDGTKRIFRDKKFTSNIGLFFGPNMPFGNYASSDIGQIASGNANTGYHFSLFYTKMFLKNLGVRIAFHSFTNDLKNGYNMISDFGPDVTFSEGTNTDKRWENSGIDLYVSYRMKLSQRSQLTVHSGFALSSTHFDHIGNAMTTYLNWLGNPETLRYEYREAKGQNFYFKILTEYGFKLSDRFALTLTAGITTGNTTVKGSYLEFINDVWTLKRNDYVIDVISNNFNIGIGTQYSFKPKSVKTIKPKI